MMRSITGCFDNKQVTVLAVSVYHSLLLAGSNQHTLSIFDYEFIKLMNVIEF